MNNINHLEASHQDHERKKATGMHSPGLYAGRLSNYY